jgi:hypothetical protein
MTSISLFMPPKDDEATKQGVLRLLNIAQELQIPVEPQGFAMAWLSDHTRMFIASEGDKTTGLGVLVFGRRYYDADISATILIAKGPARQELLKFMSDSAKVLGASELFYETETGDSLGGEPTPLRRVMIT